MKHKHCDLIVAWANGAEIEYKDTIHGMVWRILLNNPGWLSNVEYRIKPETKPDVQQQFRFLLLDEVSPYLSRHGDPTIKVVFNGETGLPKSVEIIK